MSNVLPFPARKSIDEPLQPLAEFLEQLRAKSSATYKPQDGGVLAHDWRYREHHAYAEPNRPKERKGGRRIGPRIREAE